MNLEQNTIEISNIPYLTWYQNKKNIEITILLNDVSQENIDISKNNIKLYCVSNYKKYFIDLELFNSVNIENNLSFYKITPRYIKFFIKKDIEDEWDYLILNKNNYKKYISYDWEKSEDSDENDNENNYDNMMNNPEFLNMMQNMGEKNSEENNFSNLETNHEEDSETTDDTED